MYSQFSVVYYMFALQRAQLSLARGPLKITPPLFIPSHYFCSLSPLLSFPYPSLLLPLHFPPSFPTPSICIPSTSSSLPFFSTSYISSPLVQHLKSFTQTYLFYYFFLVFVDELVGRVASDASVISQVICDSVSNLSCR